MSPQPCLLLPETPRSTIREEGVLAVPKIIYPEESISDRVLTLSDGFSNDPTAYIMFTSGSTGVPKGVRILHDSVCKYVDSMIQLLGPSPHDRFTQLFEFSFDLSVHDLFVTWGCGGCLYVLPQSAALNPIVFVSEHQLTHWFSVPSTAALAQRLHQLKPGVMPSLRVSLVLW